MNSNGSDDLHIIQESQRGLVSNSAPIQFPKIQEKTARNIPREKLERIANSNFYWKKIGAILLIELSVVFILLLRGGKGISSIVGAEKCTLLDWLIFLGYAVLSISFFSLSLFIVISESKARIKCNWVEHKDEVKLDKKLYLGGSLTSFFVGMLSVIVGIGGSLLTTPMLLSIGVLPEVISYTSMYLTTLSAIITTTVFVISGTMPIDFLLFIGFLVIIGVLLAEWQVSKLVKKMGRQSLITFFFTFINVISWCLVAYSVYNEFDGLKGLIAFENYCSIE